MFAPDEQNEILSALERVSKLVGFSAAFIYLAGFVVVSRYLSRYGVYSLSIFQLQYLVAGTWAVAPLVGITLTLRSSQQFGGTAWEKWGRFTWRRLAVISTVTTLPFGLALGAVAGLFGDVEGLKWAAISRLALSYWILANCIDAAWISWRVKPEFETWWANRKAVSFYLTLLGVLFFIYILYFAGAVYPGIPFSLGGGRPLSVMFLSGEKSLPDGILRDGTSHRSIPYKLIAVTDKSYIVLSQNKNEQSIEFNREAVQGMVILRESVKQP